MAKANSQARGLTVEPSETGFSKDQNGFINIGSVTGVVSAVVIAIVVLLILAALADDFITAIADVVGAVEGGTTNNTTADALLPVFGLLIALAGVFAIVALVMRATKIRGGRN